MDHPFEDVEPLLRRICAVDHVVFDEGDGSASLNWAALTWDDDGVSVYREVVLEHLSLDRFSILEGKYSSLATTTKWAVETFEHQVEGQAMHPFLALESPRTAPPPRVTDPAHASIVISPNHGLSRKQLGKAQRRLAGRAFVVEHLA